MRQALMFLISIGFLTFAHAGKMNFTCKSEDGSILLSQEYLVLQQKDDVTQGLEVVVFNNLNINQTPSAGASINIGRIYNNEVVGTFEVSEITNIKKIAGEEGGTCPGGHGPGFSTEEYRAKGQFSVFGQMKKAIELSCVETLTWSGNCIIE